LRNPERPNLRTMDTETTSVEPEVVPGNPRLRSITLLVVAAALAFGFATLRWFLPWLSHALLQARADGRITIPLACYLFLALMLTIGASVIAFGIHVFRFGRRVAAGAMYPPAGARVIWDTRVIRGQLAVATGRIQTVLGVLLVLSALVLIGLSIYGIVLIL
jgi:hypothetical protein